MNAPAGQASRAGPFGWRARCGTGLARLLTRWAARRFSVFPVPGAETVIASGFDPEQRRVRLAASPRMANVLLVVGPLAEPGRQAAAIAYAQMPRPRWFVAVGNDVAGDELPPANAVLETKDLTDLANALSALLEESGSDRVEPFAPAFLRRVTGEDADEDEEDGHSHSHHDAPDDHEHHEHDHEDGDEGDHEHEGHEHYHEQGGGHEHHGHDHGGGGFMSMVAMTKDMPRGSDGLQMESVEASFGPLHPGLPAGVAVKLTLGGDTVQEARWSGGLLIDDLSDLEATPGGLTESYTDLHPTLARTRRALADIHRADRTVDGWHNAITGLEEERILSHLGWLVSFSRLLGFARLHEAAARALHAASQGQLTSEQARGLESLVHRTPYLRRRLRGVGAVPSALLDELSGPVARAAGRAADARVDIDAYRQLGFAQVEEDGNDAWARLLVRLREIIHSLELITRARDGGVTTEPAAPEGATSQTPTVLESPQGKASISGTEGAPRLRTPLPVLIRAIGPVARGAELSDALVAIASLDPTPWLHPLAVPEDTEEEEDQDGDGHHHHHHHGGHQH